MSEKELTTGSNVSAVEGGYGNTAKWTIRILYIIHTLIYLPIGYLLTPWLMFVVMLRCFFIPYIFTVVLSILYILMLRKREISTHESLFFGIMLIINIINMVCVETFFNAAMGI